MTGVRLEKPETMEWKHMIITAQQNSLENGYGKGAEPSSNARILRMWAEFYGAGDSEQNYFQTYDEAMQDASGKYLPLGNGQYLNVDIYKKRIRVSVEPFLLEANECAKREGKKAYVHAVGIGLGVWKLSERQGPLMVDVLLARFGVPCCFWRPSSSLRYDDNRTSKS